MCPPWMRRVARPFADFVASTSGSFFEVDTWSVFDPDDLSPLNPRAKWIIWERYRTAMKCDIQDLHGIGSQAEALGRGNFCYFRMLQPKIKAISTELENLIFLSERAQFLLQGVPSKKRLCTTLLECSKEAKKRMLAIKKTDYVTKELGNLTRGMLEELVKARNALGQMDAVFRDGQKEWKELNKKSYDEKLAFLTTEFEKISQAHNGNTKILGPEPLMQLSEAELRAVLKAQKTTRCWNRLNVK